MPYARSHQYLTLAGTLFGAERFAFGFRLNTASGSFPPDQAGQQELCEDYSAAIEGWWSAQATIGNPARLDLVKLNAIGVDGKYLNPWTNQKEIVGGLPGNNPVPFPAQVALVVTLESGFTRGRAARGRVFLPSPGVTIEAAGGRMSAAVRDGAATQVVQLLDAIHAVEVGRRIIVASKLGGGSERSITSISIGRVLDTMRSRRTSLDEDRASSPLAGASF